MGVLQSFLKPQLADRCIRYVTGRVEAPAQVGGELLGGMEASSP